MLLPASIPAPGNFARWRFQRRWMALIDRIIDARLGSGENGAPRDLFDLLRAARNPVDGLHPEAITRPGRDNDRRRSRDHCHYAVLVTLSARSCAALAGCDAAFINSDIRLAQQEGHSRENIVAGLVYAIAAITSPRSKASARWAKRFLQGGVALNRALGNAFAHTRAARS